VTPRRPRLLYCLHVTANKTDGEKAKKRRQKGERERGPLCPRSFPLSFPISTSGARDKWNAGADTPLVAVAIVLVLVDAGARA